MKLCWFAACIALLLLAVPADAGEKAQQKVLLVRVTTLLDRSTDRTPLVFRTVAAGLQKGHRVGLHFDAEGVSSLKMGRWFGGHSTPIDRITIPPKERKELAGLLGTTPDGIPDIYGSLLHFLKGRGVAVSASRKALELRGLWPDKYDQAAEPIDDVQAMEFLTRSAWQISY